jgi:hypothetical protein
LFELLHNFSISNFSSLYSKQKFGGKNLLFKRVNFTLQRNEVLSLGFFYGIFKDC